MNFKLNWLVLCFKSLILEVPQQFDLAGRIKNKYKFLYIYIIHSIHTRLKFVHITLCLNVLLGTHIILTHNYSQYWLDINDVY